VTKFNCCICNSTNATQAPVKRDGHDITCPRCGHFFISRTAATVWKNKSADDQEVANASGWIREHPNIEITSYEIDNLLTLKTPRIIERANKILLALEKRSPNILTSHTIRDNNSEEWLAISYSTNLLELTYLFGILRNKHLVFGSLNADSVIDVTISAEGYDYLENLRLKPSNSQLGFCAMWFSESVLPIWIKAIEPAIRDAGYDPKRIDSHQHNNRIDDEIIAMLRRSKFVVADFTGQRGGVYFEAGFALGLGLQVIWTCKKSELDENKIHFDTRQYNFVTWEDGKLEDFKIALQNRIEATIGRGNFS
jgi:nucleoside 2-deoxyribosyltransferase